MKKICLVLICLFCLNACSTKVAYGFMGLLTKWYIGNYVSLNKEQKALVSETMEEFKAWHRRTQLPIYADYLDGVANRLKKDNIDGQWIHAETDKVQIFLDTSLAQLKPSMIELMSSFSDEQVEELLESFVKEREKYTKKRVNISQKKTYNKRVDELKDQTSRFFGRLNQEQKSWVTDWSKQLKPYEALSVEQQKVWADKVATAMEVRHDKEKLSVLIDEIVFYRTDDWEPELEAILDHNQKISYELVAKLVNSLSSTQQKKMYSKLAGYKDDCISLSENPD